MTSRNSTTRRVAALSSQSSPMRKAPSSENSCFVCVVFIVVMNSSLEMVVGSGDCRKTNQKQWNPVVVCANTV